MEESTQVVSILSTVTTSITSSLIQPQYHMGREATETISDSKFRRMHVV